MFAIHCIICAEGNKCILPGYFNTDYDAAPYFLSNCLFAPKVPFSDFPISYLMSVCNDFCNVFVYFAVK
jgi:hypothetical protein